MENILFEYHVEKVLANSTFSETCIVIHIHEKDQQDAHFFSLFQLNYPLHQSLYYPTNAHNVKT